MRFNAVISPLLVILASLAIEALPSFAAAADDGAESPAISHLAATDDLRVCGQQTLLQERAMHIPDRLLHAISLVESGRWDNDHRASFAWPWTVDAEGEGHFLPSKEAAIAEVKRLKARGIANIDVGCMQVNLQAHPDAFANLDEAFDPAANVAYGARFLAELRANTPDWETAGAYYHSQTPSLAAEYKAKLIAAWSAARKRPDERAATQLAGLDIEAPIGMVLPTPRQDDALSANGLHALAAAAAEQAAVEREAGRAKSAADKAEAKRIADAYRNARLAEYRARKLQMADAHG